MRNFRLHSSSIFFSKTWRGLVWLSLTLFVILLVDVASLLGQDPVAEDSRRPAEPLQQSQPQQRVDQPVDSSDTNSSGISQEVATELSAIREQLGGGISKQLEGLSSGFDTEKEFKNEVNRLVDQRRHDATDVGRTSIQYQPNQNMDSRAGVQRPIRRQTETYHPNSIRNQGIEPTRISEPNLFYDRRVEPTVNFDRRPNLEPSRRADLASDDLRKVARQLEETAASLEEIGDYGLADQLRDRARAIWQQARRN